MAYLAETLLVSLAGLSAAAFFIYGGLGLFGAIVLELAPERSRAAFSGVINSVGQIGGAAAPILVGYLVNATGSFASGFGCMIAGLCIGAVCLLAIAPRVAAGAVREAAVDSPADTGIGDDLFRARLSTSPQASPIHQAVPPHRRT